jgi:hypothetical protein
MGVIGILILASDCMRILSSMKAKRREETRCWKDVFGWIGLGWMGCDGVGF